MPYLTDLHTYLHQSSLLIQAYPSSRITTKYSLPRKPNTKSKSKPKETAAPPTNDSTAAGPQTSKRERSAVLTLKTYHPESGICLKYRTDKAAEVGRLLTALGRLAKGEVIEMPTTTTAAPTAAVPDGDKMEVDSGPVAAPKLEEKTVTAAPAATQGASGGGGGKSKKKKGKK